MNSNKTISPFTSSPAAVVPLISPKDKELLDRLAAAMAKKIIKSANNNATLVKTTAQ